MTYTPGPWQAVRDDCHFGSLSTVIAGNMIVQVGGSKSSVEEMEANARLIAAAPDLLAALKEAFAAPERLYKSEAFMNRVAGVIAKAEGRET